jgi:predicted O-methyltransferase YrrM
MVPEPRYRIGMREGRDSVSEARRRFAATAADLPAGDYVSPGLDIVRPDDCFPHLTRGDPSGHPWPYLRREVPHAWYVDAREPLMGFVNRDEAAMLYNYARAFAGKRALEIGCWKGWSTCHLGLGGVLLDVIDPALAEPGFRGEVEAAIACCGLDATVRLHAGSSPDAIDALAADGEGWSLFFIDGDHEAPGPERDIEACLRHAAPNAAFLFHDLASPQVAEALRLMEARGFHVLVYQTMQIMGVAWRGDVRPVRHIPDPSVAWQLPHHLVGFPVSGVTFSSHQIGMRMALAERDRLLADKDAAIEALDERLRRAGLRNRLKRLFGLKA